MAEDEGKGSGALAPLREQTVDFYGDRIPVAQAEDGELYVPVRPLITFLGLDPTAQRRRIARDNVLQARARLVLFTGADGFRRDMLCLPLDLLPGWLFGVTTSKVKPELAEKIDRYRAECFKVLWQAFRADIVPAAGPPPVDLSPAEQALVLAEAVANLARQQLGYEGRLAQYEGQLTDVAGRQQVMAEYLRGFIQRTEGRLTALEMHLSAGATVSEAQAAELALTVKNVARALEQRGTANAYQRVYSEMYRRYRISSYKSLPAARYQEVLDWLAGWHNELQPGDEV